MNTKTSILTAAMLGLTGVALGAFGAHALKGMLEASGRLDTYELAIRYQFYHALALLGTGLLQLHYTSVWLRRAATFFVLGVILFSGSLYMLCLTQVTAMAIITPLGGVVLIAGWAAMLGGIGKS